MTPYFKCFFLLIFISYFYTSFAQSPNDKINDNELFRYAVMMDSIESMKNHIIEMMTWEVENYNISGARFNELSSIIDDKILLKRAMATDAEIKFILMVREKKNRMTDNIKETFKKLAIDYVGDGGRVYMKVKHGIENDYSIGMRYEAILADVQKRNQRTSYVSNSSSSSNSSILETIPMKIMPGGTYEIACVVVLLMVCPTSLSLVKLLRINELGCLNTKWLLRLKS